MHTQPIPTPTIDSVFHPVITTLARLVQGLRDGRGVNLFELRVMLDTLPLSTEEYGLACNRLGNAQRYMQAQEAGAALWELNALTQRLRSHVGAEVREPRRRQS